MQINAVLWGYILLSSIKFAFFCCKIWWVCYFVESKIGVLVFWKLIIIKKSKQNKIIIISVDMWLMRCANYAHV